MFPDEDHLLGGGTRSCGGGGLWIAAEAIGAAAVSRDQVAALGQDALAVVTDSMQACVTAGHSASTDPHADAIALWLGLHGLAHQRAVTAAFPWPADITTRMVTSLAHLTADPRNLRTGKPAGP